MPPIPNDARSDVASADTRAADSAGTGCGAVTTGTAPSPDAKKCFAISSALFALAAAAVGVAIHFYDGEYHPKPGGMIAIALITLAIVAAAAAIVWPRRLIARSAAGPICDTSASSPIPRQGCGGQCPPHKRAQSSRTPGEGGVPARLRSTLTILFAAQIAILLFSRPDSWQHPYLQPKGLATLAIYRTGIAAAAALAAIAVACVFRTRGSVADGLSTRGAPVCEAASGAAPFPPRRAVPDRVSRITRTFTAPALWLTAAIILFTALGAWSLACTSAPHSDVHPHIDVFVFQQQGARALLHGQNPYAIDDFPDIYADPVTGKARQEVYGPGMSDGRVLHFGFPYLPASLYLATAGYALTGDYRSAQLAALALSALLIYRAKPGWTSALAAGLLLFTPRVFFILISGWTEPFLVLWMSASLYAALRRPRWLPIALGLLLATKQYMALAVIPMSVLQAPRPSHAPGWHGFLPAWRPWITLLILSGLVAMAVTAPLALWDWKKFYFSVVTVQRYAPFRWDALSYLTWRAFGHGEPSPATTVLLPAAMSAIAILLCLWRAPRTPAGFAGSVGFVMLVFFACSKQAFANYYFFVIGALCCAVAGGDKACSSATERVSLNRGAIT